VDFLRDAAGGYADKCERIRERHGDYLDGVLPVAEQAQVQSHLAECLSCARYDRVLRRGLGVARQLPELRPAEDFELRLQHHIYHLQAGAPFGQPRPFAGIGVAATLAAAIALIAWSPFVLLDRAADLTATGVAAEHAAVAAFPPTDPLGAVAVSWYPGHFPALPTHPRDVLPTVFPGPYSPLIVNPPVHGGPVRMISSEYRTE
jgi:hypothetical protein